MNGDRWTRLGVRTWTLIGILILTYVGVTALRTVLPLLWALVVAAVVGYLLAPVVAWLQRLRVPRPVGTFLAIVVLAALFGGAGLLLIPPLVDQVSQITEGLPTSVGEAERELRALGERFGLDIEIDLDGAAIAGWLEQQENREAVVGVLSGVGVATRVVGLGAVMTLAGLVIGFYLLVGLPKITEGLAGLIPADRRAGVMDVVTRCVIAVGAYLRGQLVVAAFVGTASSLLLWAIGLRYWLFVGVVAGVTNLVPFVGPWVGGILAVTIALLTGNPLQAVWAAVVIFIVQQVESQVVSPLVLGRAVRLPAIAVLIVVLLGGLVAGLIGMIIAVPVAACVRIVLWHRSSLKAAPGGR